MEYKGRVALCFLVTRNLNNLDVWENWWQGYEEYFDIYVHISGPKTRKKNYWEPILWDNRIEKNGVKATMTKWGTTSLVIAEGLLYKSALKDKENKFFCLISESGLPVFSFRQLYTTLFKHPNKSYLQTETMRGGDEDLFLDCFPEDLIPTSKKPIPKTIDDRDMRYWLWRKTHQWKVLNRRDTKEFVKMIGNKRFMNAYSKCFYQLKPHDPRLAADEIAFPNWVILKYGPKGFDKRFFNFETTFVDFDKTGTHGQSHKHFTSKLHHKLCNAGAFFARKFEPNPEWINHFPIKNCKKIYNNFGYTQLPLSNFQFGKPKRRKSRRFSNR